MKLKCPICLKHDAFTHPYYGILPCLDCRKKQEKYKKPGAQTEFTTQAIKEQRKEFRKDILQPYRNGEVSKEYIEQWGTKAIKADPKEIKNAKRVWSGSDAVGYYD